MSGLFVAETCLRFRLNLALAFSAGVTLEQAAPDIAQIMHRIGLLVCCLVHKSLAKHI